MAAKTYDYIVTIKPARNYRGFNWLTQLLLLIAFALIAYTLFQKKLSQTLIAEGIICLVIIAGGWIFPKLTFFRTKYSLVAAALGIFIIVGNSWVALAYFILSLLERQINFMQELGVDEYGVTFNSFPKKIYHWNQISNIVLKDGLITLDLNNNRIFQKELDNDTTLEMESEFNEFCRSHIHSSAVPVS
jgi:hypothetical protein